MNEIQEMFNNYNLFKYDERDSVDMANMHPDPKKEKAPSKLPKDKASIIIRI